MLIKRRQWRTRIMDNSTLLAYQPIYDRQLDIVGGELLYRNDNGLSVLDVGEEYATSELIFQLCTGITEQFEGFNHPLYINVSKDFVLSDAFLPLEPSRVIVELVERIEPTPELIEAIARWHKKGFRFALDDFELSPAWQPLFKYCDVVKIDIEQTSPEQLQKIRNALSNKPMKWLAERVETHAQLEHYKRLGFDYFQGYFLSRPITITGQKINPAGVNLGQIIQLLYSAEVDIQKLTEAVSREPTMSLKLLKIANSPFYRGQSEISSLQQALMRIGLEQLKRWVVLIASLEGGSTASVHHVLTRAMACAELARNNQALQGKAEQAFLAALLSGVDILIGVDKEAFIGQLTVSDEIQQAALKQRGVLGGLVSMVINVEHAAHGHGGKVNPRVLSIYNEQNLRTRELLNTLA
ncbi:EAL and HDOD domain-containing protein [Aliidiomarina soli]|nr:HDOD domain-containing protein [Aliidiomarina soli]